MRDCALFPLRVILGASHQQKINKDWATALLNAHKILIVHSPHSGRSSQLDAAIASLQAHSLEVIDVLSIAELDGLPYQGSQWKERGIDIVVAAGGDGLVGGVTTHIADIWLAARHSASRHIQRYRTFSQYSSRCVSSR